MSQSYEETLQRLGEIWRAVLEVEAVGPDDNFFTLGGDSMKATVVMVAIEEAYGLLLDPTEIFEFPVLREFADMFGGQLQASLSGLASEEMVL